MAEEHGRCIKCECSECKAKFDIWLDESFRTPEAEADKDPDIEANIRKNIGLHCPVCQLKKE